MIKFVITIFRLSLNSVLLLVISLSIFISLYFIFLHYKNIAVHLFNNLSTAIHTDILTVKFISYLYLKLYLAGDCTDTVINASTPVSETMTSNLSKSMHS